MRKNLHFALIFSILCIESTPLFAQSSRLLTGRWGDGECSSGLLTVRDFSDSGSHTVYSAYVDNNCNLKQPGLTKTGNGGYQLDRNGRVIITESYIGNSRNYQFVCQPQGQIMKCQSLASGRNYIWSKI
ncbi:hypothetical protein [Microcystis aeruginosa]|uniref:hypothetical protein n=1 Tax=Microcystis aeruginosa TaxID=1126 RepID=UPI001C0FC015|nr:hypothetical protein [Microcystis aeruginosa]